MTKIQLAAVRKPVQLFKAQATGIVIVDLMYCIF